MKILVTGGAGYIGSHCALELIKKGYEVTILDNLEKGHQETLDTITRLAGEYEFLKLDLRDLEKLREGLQGKHFDCVIHFAAYLEVGLSVKKPAMFFENNVVGSQYLFQTLLDNDIKNVIFSSSAAVYGTQEIVPIKEDADKHPDSPYGETKLLMERILESYCQYAGMNAVALRYFNPAGSHGSIGERHYPETHAVPRVLKALMDENFPFAVFGNDYDTPDGSCIRDFIHISDVVDAHISCIDYLNSNKGFETFNVATGSGTSVLELIKTAEEVTGKKLNYKIQPRREGDPARLIADPAKIFEKMGWKSKFNIKDILQSAWEFEQTRPQSDYN